MKRIHSAVIGALALTFAGAGFAAGSADPTASNPGATSSSSSAAMKAPDLSQDFKSTDLIGLNVTNRQNQSLGSISNLIVDSSGKVAYVVLNNTSGGGTTAGNKYIIPWNRVQLTPGQSVAMVDVDQNALPSEFAAFDESMTAPVSGNNAPSQNLPPSGGSSGSMGGSSGESSGSMGGSSDMGGSSPSGSSGGSSGGNY